MSEQTKQSEQTGQEPDLAALKNAVRQVVESGSDMQARIRDLMLSSLASARLDLRHMKRVTRTVIEGIGEAAETRGGETAKIVQQSLAGVEDALSQAGEASVLALREATGKAGEFASHDLKQAIEELTQLQHVYSDALGEVLADVAHAGADTVHAMFEDFHTHARNSGSAFAGRMADSLERLRELVPVQSLHAGAEQMQSAADRLGKIASGFLRGIQQGLAEQQSSEAAEAETPAADTKNSNNPDERTRA
jgi:Family of unknown function (DUF6781)